MVGDALGISVLKRLITGAVEVVVPATDPATFSRHGDLVVLSRHRSRKG